MSICKVFVPYGSVGFGISQEDFDAAMALKPDIISSDADSTDSALYYLGNGKCKYSRESVKADIRMMIVAAHKSGIQFLLLLAVVVLVVWMIPLIGYQKSAVRFVMKKELMQK